MPYGTKLDLTPAKTLYDYEFIKVDGLNKPIVSDGTVVTYYYKNKNEEHTHNLTLVAAKLPPALLRAIPHTTPAMAVTSGSQMQQDR